MLAELDRRARAIATTLVLTAAVASCGGGGAADSGAAPGTAQRAFPVTIEHRYVPLLQEAVDGDPNTAVPAA